MTFNWGMHFESPGCCIRYDTSVWDPVLVPTFREPKELKSGHVWPSLELSYIRAMIG